MIEFFRNYRYHLLKNGRFRKYIKYAVGEIILVVIGILIAVQVNNWNIQRENNSFEAQILIQLKNEYKSNLNQLEAMNDRRTNLIMHSASKLLAVLDKENAEINIDSINFYLSRTLIAPSFDPANGVTEEVINSGKLQLIRNDNLRIQLTNWSSITNDLLGEEKYYTTLINDQYTNFLIKNYHLRPLVTLLQSDKAIETILKADNSGFNIGGNRNEIDLDELLENKDFEDYLSLIMGWCNFLNNTTNQVIKANQDILELIEG